MKAYNLMDDELLSQALLDDDKHAFEEIYKRYWYKLYGIALKQTSSRSDSEEIIQTLFERLWKNRKKVRIKNLEVYLVISVRNIIIDRIRKSARMRPLTKDVEIQEITNITEEEVDHAFLLLRVEHILKELPEKTREIFSLSRFENKTNREIANRLQVTEKAIEYHLSRAIKVFRRHLNNYLRVFL